MPGKAVSGVNPTAVPFSELAAFVVPVLVVADEFWVEAVEPGAGTVAGSDVGAAYAVDVYESASTAINAA